LFVCFDNALKSEGKSSKVICCLKTTKDRGYGHKEARKDVLASLNGAEGKQLEEILHGLYNFFMFSLVVNYFCFCWDRDLERRSD
jgi:hypothetical protein